MLIGLGENMTCINFGLTRSEVKVTRVLFAKNISAHFLKNYYFTELYYYTCRRPWYGHVLLSLDTLGSRLRSQGSFVKM